MLPETPTTLPQLGQRLKAARKAAFPMDDLNAFALRLGVARSTLQRMEQGDLSVALSRYYRAAELLDMTEGFHQLFVKEKSLFDD
ncbi:helix-turn-helix domain-containing protein [Marinimicrobium locisalis]|uniref:helix-turn-helix domain-containing protein n=1 Tax=Marinimicrobium locisalis TaxID=546022 RepID=UPI003221EB50